MRRPLTLFAVLSLALPLFAQAPLVEKIEVSIVNVDVTVTDRAGNPVRGLTGDDFEIREDGVPQAITNFYVVDRSPQTAGRAEASAAPGDERFRRKVLVLIDNFSTTRFERDQALSRLEEFIDSHFSGGEYDWSIALVAPGARMLLAPTSDKQEIHAAVDEIRRTGTRRMPPSLIDDMRVAEGSAVAPRNSDQIGSAEQARVDNETYGNYDPNAERLGLPQQPGAADRRQYFARQADLLEQTMLSGEPIQGIVEATRAFAATPGKKIIVLLTGQLLPNDNVSLVDYDPRYTPDFGSAMKRIAILRKVVIEEANASNVNFYIINPEGIAGGDPSMYWIAGETGGRLLPGNDVAASLRQFDTRSSNFYSLGYRPSHPEDGESHRINVRVKKGRYALQYRNSYSSVPNDIQLVRALQSPFGASMLPPSTIPVTLAFDRLRNDKGAVLVQMKTTVPAGRLQFVPAGEGKVGRVDIFVSIFDADGRNIALTRLTRNANIPKGEAQSGTFGDSTPVRLARGRQYRVVVAVRDKLTDAVGVTQQLVRF